jgi:hypothetical protein
MKKDLITISEDKGWKLLEQITINDRSLICWYNPNDGVISLSLFHLTDQPNELSKKSPYSTWGYVTYLVTNMMTSVEAAEVVGLYLKDIENENAWWEKDL